MRAPIPERNVTTLVILDFLSIGLYWGSGSLRGPTLLALPNVTPVTIPVPFQLIINFVI
jgi:hypothetical protein